MSELETKLKNSHLNGDDSDEKKKREEAEVWKEKGNEAFKSKNQKHLKNCVFLSIEFCEFISSSFKTTITAKLSTSTPKQSTWYQTKRPTTATEVSLI